jgi:glycosyltransferase involved in cell wall biosynthesis
MDYFDRPDILHCWGLEPYSYLIALRRAKAAGIKTVVTVLLPSRPTGAESVGYHARRLVSRLMQVKREFRRLTDAVVVVSDEQQTVVVKDFGFRAAHSWVIPNIVADDYWTAAESQANQRGDYVLCVGNICRRKNQLSLAMAAVAGGVRLVLVGGTVPGEEDYFARVMAVVATSPLIEYVGEVPSESSNLRSLYREAAALVLLSHMEIQPLSVLEAMVSGTPVCLLDRPYTHQSTFRGALRVKDDAPRTIRDALEKLRSDPGQFTIERHHLEQFRSTRVAEQARELYASVTNG